MPRCSHCGKVNREGSLFCQDCGHRLEAAPQPAQKQPAGPVCGACGTANPPGMNFCKMCGTSLAARPVEAAPEKPQPQPGKVDCPSCGKQTPGGFAFCQHCGQRLAQAAAPQARGPSSSQAVPAGGAPVSAVAQAAMSGHGMAAGVAPAQVVTPTPPAGMPRGMQLPSAAPVSRPQPVASEEAMAKTVAPQPASLEAARPPAQKAIKPTLEPYKPDTLVDEPARARLGTLVAVKRDGSDGEAVPLYGETFDVGRSEGALNFADDPYLAPRHARLFGQGGKDGKEAKVILRPLDHTNGVFVRVQGACELSPGDQFLVGKELLRYEPLGPEERDPPSLTEHGVRLFGSSPREAWGRLRQLTVAGTTRDVWHLTRPELVLGREEGDVTFPDDEFMSRRHAAVKRVGPKARLEDLNSSNGTFVRLRGDRELRPGDVLRMGDQLLRFEP